MSERITSTGTTVSIVQESDGSYVYLDHPGAPADMRPAEAGRVIEGRFQSAAFCAFAMSPEVLRTIADLIEEQK